MDEFAALKEQVSALKRTEAEMKERCNLLQEQLQDQSAEKMLLEVELKRKSSDHEESLERFHRLNEEIERRVKERTAELEQACRQMQQLDELKDSFLSSVSHELRTPLTSIRSFSEILLNYEDVDPESQKEFLQIINLESERLTRLINDVLDLSKIESGNMVWHDDLVSLKQIIEEAAKAQRPLFQKKSLELTLDLPVDLPLVFADRDRVHQVVTNILGNAVKFSPEGSAIRIRAEKHWSGGLDESLECIKVSITDQGRGVARDDLHTIFDKFRQATADTLKDKPEGTGLGLPICREIITRYKGELWVESEEGKGSTFSFRLPVSTEP